MKVLFVESYPHVIMGQQRTLLALLKASKEKGVDPVVACTAEGIYTDKLREEGYSVEIFSYPDTLQVYGGEIYRYGLFKKCKAYLQIFSYVLDIKKKLKDLKVDAVYCNDMRGILTVGVAAKLAGIPVITWDKLDKPHGWLDWVQLPLVNKNLVISDSVRVKYPSFQNKLFDRRITKVHDGAYIDVIDNASSLRTELGFSDDDVVIAIVGTITHRKGHDRLFAILSDLLDYNNKVKVLVVGDIADKETDAQYRDQLPLFNHPSVTKLGYRDDIPNIMQSIDILCVPSRNEGTPLVIMEAMAAYKPVVGADAGGIAEVIEHENTGFVFEGDNREQFLQYLKDLCDSPELVTKMGLLGRKRVEEKFDCYKQLNFAVDEIKKLTY